MKNLKLFKYVFKISLLLSVLFSVFTYFSYKQDYKEQKEKIISSLHSGVEKIEKFVSEHENIASNTIKISKNNNRDQLSELYDSILEENRYVTHIRLMKYKDSVLLPNESLYLVKKTDNNNNLSDSIGKYYSTTYINLTNKQIKQWDEPYKCLFTEEYIVNYTISDSSKNMVLHLGISLDTLYEFVKHLGYDSLGYTTLLSKSGRFLYHPKVKHVYSSNTVYDLADKKIAFEKKSNKENSNQTIIKNAKTLKGVCNSVRSGERGCVNYNSIVTYQDMILCYEPISNGWSALNSCLKLNITHFISSYKSKCFLLVIILLINIISGLRIFQKNRLWQAAFFSSIIIALGICALWYINLMLPEKSKEPINHLGNFGEVEKFRNQITKENPDAVIVPTGMFVQLVEFCSANNFKINGYVWQRYQLNDTTTKRGFRLPEAEKVTIKEAYHKTVGDEEVIGWYFSATIRERFDYANYPLDSERLWIRFWDADFDKFVILVPDVESYDVMNPVFKPGIEKDFVLSGWKIKGSYFSYIVNSYNTNFGISTDNNIPEYPELYFNIDITRDFIDPFITHMIPLVIVMIMLFAILLVARKNDKNGLLGFNSLAAVSAASALFFVIIFNHINLRNLLSVSGLVYFEWFYIIAYFAILYVSLNSLLIGQQVKIKYLYTQDNYYSRLLFIPIVFGLGFIVTFFVFI